MQPSTLFTTRFDCPSFVGLEFLQGFVVVSEFVWPPLSQLPPIVDRPEYSGDRTGLASWSLLRSGSYDSPRLFIVQSSEIPVQNHLSDSDAAQVGIRIQQKETPFTAGLPVSYGALRAERLVNTVCCSWIISEKNQLNRSLTIRILSFFEQVVRSSHSGHCPGRALLNPYTIVYDRAQPNTLRITVVFWRNTWLSITIVILRVVYGRSCLYIRSITERVTSRFGSYTTYFWRTARRSCAMMF